MCTLRRMIEARGCREARIASILNALRAFLKFCREVLRVPTIPPHEIRVPRIPRRDVVYLTTEEVQRFVEAIIADTVVKILGHATPRRAWCNASVVCSLPSARDSRIMSRALRPSLLATA